MFYQMEPTFECQWDTCDYQFEDSSDCMEHCIGDGGNSKCQNGSLNIITILHKGRKGRIH